MTEELAESEGIEPLDTLFLLRRVSMTAREELEAVSGAWRDTHYCLSSTVLEFGVAQTQNKVNSTV